MGDFLEGVGKIGLGVLGVAVAPVAATALLPVVANVGLAGMALGLSEALVVDTAASSMFLASGAITAVSEASIFKGISDIIGNL